MPSGEPAFTPPVETAAEQKAEQDEANLEDEKLAGLAPADATEPLTEDELREEGFSFVTPVIANEHPL